MLNIQKWWEIKNLCREIEGSLTSNQTAASQAQIDNLFLSILKRNCDTLRRKLIGHDMETGQIDRKGDYIITASGRRFWIEDPHADDIYVDDIAHSLAMQCRYTGHTRRFYSVAQHCIHVAYFCPDKYKPLGLMHDAAEAYIGDIHSILKSFLGKKLEDLESSILAEIFDKFDIVEDEEGWEIVKDLDQRIRVNEQRDVCNEEIKQKGKPLDFTIAPIRFYTAKRMFLKEFVKYVQKSN